MFAWHQIFFVLYEFYLPWNKNPLFDEYLHRESCMIDRLWKSKKKNHSFDYTDRKIFDVLTEYNLSMIKITRIVMDSGTKKHFMYMVENKTKI